VCKFDKSARYCNTIALLDVLQAEISVRKSSVDDAHQSPMLNRRRLLRSRALHYLLIVLPMRMLVPLSFRSKALQFLAIAVAEARDTLRCLGWLESQD
jgi:hypothetical protein